MNEQTETIFPQGMMIKKRKPESAPRPDFILEEFSFKCDEFAAFMQQHQSNGWINVTMKRSKAGNVYLALDTWKPTMGDAAQTGLAQAKAAAEPDPFEDSTIPF